MEVFSSLDDSAIKSLAEQMEISTYKKGQTIIEYGIVDDT